MILNKKNISRNKHTFRVSSSILKGMKLLKCYHRKIFSHNYLKISIFTHFIAICIKVTIDLAAEISL